MNIKAIKAKTRLQTARRIAMLATCGILWSLPIQAGPDSDADKEPEQEAKYITHEVELFITEIMIVNGTLYAAKLVWLPPHMVSICMGRTVYNCEEVRYMQATQHQQHVASITGKLKFKEKENIPPTTLEEWISPQHPRYQRSAKTMLEPINKLPAIQKILQKTKDYPQITQRLEPLHVHYSIHATVGYEPWDPYHQYRIINLSSNLHDNSTLETNSP